MRTAEPRDAFAVAALHLQAERERGHQIPPGFLDSLADAWLRDRSRVTWIAEDGNHNPVGAVHGTVARTLPSPRRPGSAWMHVGFLYVTTKARGSGLGERLLRTVIAWCAAQGVDRIQVIVADEERSLYERTGFGPPSDGLLELRVSRSPRPPG